jgi:hypothetical protein
MKAKVVSPWVNSRHPQNTFDADTFDADMDIRRRQLEIYQDLSDSADKAMASAIVLGTLLFGVLMIVVTMYRGGMILI